ncbi:MAG: hypothetical protein H8D90_02160 [Candidatus Omnitrophica bacterium]|nr:hypothetical protein [Candidatus Omnitrophota bacterium]
MRHFTPDQCLAAAAIAEEDDLHVSAVKINLVAMTGSGSYSDLEGKSEQASSVAVHKFE